MTKKVIEKIKDEQELAAFVGFIESLARMTDKAMVDAVYEKDVDFDEYVKALQRIEAYTDEENYDAAFELMKQLASLLDYDAKVVIENLVNLRGEAEEIFLDYFNEYILDTYEFEMILEDAKNRETEESEDMEEDEEMDAEEILEEACMMLLDLLDCEVNDDDGGKGNRYM